MKADYCSCTDLECPYHPSKHDKGCTPCILKNQREREVPSCLFNMVGNAEELDSFHFEDFARLVMEAEGADKG